MAFFNPAGMMPGPAAGQMAWMQAQTPASMSGFGNAANSLQMQNGLSNQSTALTNRINVAMAQWTNQQMIASTVMSVNKQSMDSARTLGTMLLGNASKAIQAMGQV